MINLLVFLVMVVILNLETCSGDPSKSRAWNLFSIVQFANDACVSKSPVYPSGICYSTSECEDRNGTISGTCAEGFGVCCIFSESLSGRTVSNNCTYITNPGYPNDHETSGTLVYTIEKVDSSVCRIRLDYERFELTSPNTQSGKYYGQCDTDRLTFTTTNRKNIPFVGEKGSYGNYPYLCGNNTGHHSYLDLSPMDNDTATLTFTLGDNINNIFNIKVCQYSCSDNYIASQEGCFQYFTGKVGILTSYNFAGGHMLAAQNTKSCIRREEGMCCIEYTATAFSLNPRSCSDNSPANICSVCGAGGVRESAASYITIPNGASSIQTASQVISSTDRHCGMYLNAYGYPSIQQPVVSCSLPFHFTHITGMTSVNGPDSDVADGIPGFEIVYRQLPGTC